MILERGQQELEDEVSLVLEEEGRVVDEALEELEVLDHVSFVVVGLHVDDSDDAVERVLQRWDDVRGVGRDESAQDDDGFGLDFVAGVVQRQDEALQVRLVLQVVVEVLVERAEHYLAHFFVWV